MQTLDMTRINKIIHNDRFKSLIKEITAQEQDRIFCCHGIEHSMDVARIAYIMNLEEGYDVPKDMIYAAALLHDLGRAMLHNRKDHYFVSAEYAETFLKDAGFDEKEIKQIVEAILEHNTDGFSKPGLSSLLYRADKLSRLCFSCKAYDECYWKEADKNKGVLY